MGPLAGADPAKKSIAGASPTVRAAVVRSKNVVFFITMINNWPDYGLYKKLMLRKNNTRTHNFCQPMTLVVGQNKERSY